MSNRTLNLDDRLHDYLLSVSLREPDLLKRLREETAHLPEHNMQIAPEQGQFMRLLAGLTGARRVLEIGTFTGYSALSLALVIPDDGMMVCCDVSEEWTSIGQRYWQEAGVDHKIQLRLAPAVQTLEQLLDSDEPAFDLMFIDADKENYSRYYELGLQLLRPGGLMMIDNVLWNGSVANPDNQEESTVAIREINKRIHKDDGVELSIVPIGDGLSLVRKLV